MRWGRENGIVRAAATLTQGALSVESTSGSVEV